jgi:metal-responsive CopG/Arc/MetJ family transcriptional regulator
MRSPGRPTKRDPAEPSTVLGFRLPVSELERVDDIVRETATTRSELFRRCLRLLFDEEILPNVEN